MGFEAFIAGFAYGITTVIVGQPFDVLKTTLHVNNSISSSSSSKLLTIIKDLYSQDGIKGFYRGGLTLAIGGGLIRASQFGFYEQSMKFITKKRKKNNGKEGEEVEEEGIPLISSKRIFGYFNLQVIISGFIGGIGRGLVEAPFEFIKVRRVINSSWNFKEILNGSGITIFRNSFLFCFFSIYLDLIQQFSPNINNLYPFFTGAICSNFAWLTIWPLDVIKSMKQSGKYSNNNNNKNSNLNLLSDLIKSGSLYRGLLPGLLRSTIANGCSMVVYKKVEFLLKDLK